jgi:hypothetical protein
MRVIGAAAEFLQNIGAWVDEERPLNQPDRLPYPASLHTDLSISMQMYLSQSPKEDTWNAEAYHVKVEQDMA